MAEASERDEGEPVEIAAVSEGLTFDGDFSDECSTAPADGELE